MPTHATLGLDGKVPSDQLPAGGPGGFSGAYADLTGKPTLGTAAAQDVEAFDAFGAAAAAQAAAIAASQPLDSDLTAIAALSTTAYGRAFLAMADAAAAKTALSLAKADVGLGSVDNTADAAKAVLSASTATTAGNLSGTPDLPNGTTATTQAAGTNNTTLATTAYARAAAPNASYRTLLDSSGSHTAGKVAGTYGLGQGDVAAVTGTGTAYPLNTIAIASADYPTVDGLAPKLRVRFNINCNDVAPFTGTFVCGLHPVTRPATSGGTGVCIYTIGAAVSGSTVTGTNLAADSANLLVGSDFALPANGQYVLAFVTNQTMATNSHVHVSASLQLRNN